MFQISGADADRRRVGEARAHAGVCGAFTVTSEEVTRRRRGVRTEGTPRRAPILTDAF